MIREGSLSRAYGEYKALEEEVSSLVDYLEGRFGIPTMTWRGYRWAQREGTRSIWVMGRGEGPDEGMNLDTWGVAAFRMAPPEGYPTNAFMRAFGHLARDGVFQLGSAEALQLYMAGQNTRDGVPPRDRGYCIVQYEGLALGRGKWTGEQLVSDLPKSLRTIPPSKKGA